MRPCILYLYIFLVSVSQVQAGDKQPSKSLTLGETIIKVLEQSPQIKANDYESKAAAERIRAAQLSPALKTSIELENFGGSGDRSGTNSLESTLSLSKVLELGGKARLRGEVANRKATILRNEQDAQRLDILAETAKQFIHVITDQERLLIAQDSVKLAKQTLKTVKRRVHAGKSPNAELRRAEITLAEESIELEHAQHELQTSRLKLAILWGDTRADFQAIKSSLFAIEPMPPFETLAVQIDQNPDLVRFASEQRLAAARVQLAQSRRRSDIEISGGIRHSNINDDTGFLVAVTIPLDSTSRAKPFIDEAELLKLREPHVYEQKRLELHATLYELYQEIQHAIEAVTTLRETILPLYERVLGDYEKGYRAGRYSFLELTEVQRSLLESRLNAIMTAADYHQYRIEIDRLTGAGLLTGVKP